MSNKEIYNRIKIAGLLSFIPIVLAAGPLGGYVLGDFLEKKFSLPSYTHIICIGIGFIGSIRETIRIIGIALRSEGEK
ncbi:MAG: AtpZ/AtpI family protein [Candidatus Omnitrophota bacterium]